MAFSCPLSFQSPATLLLLLLVSCLHFFLFSWPPPPFCFILQHIPRVPLPNSPFLLPCVSLISLDSLKTLVSHFLPPSYCTYKKGETQLWKMEEEKAEEVRVRWKIRTDPYVPTPPPLFLSSLWFYAGCISSEVHSFIVMFVCAAHFSSALHAFWSSGSLILAHACSPAAWTLAQIPFN